MEERVIGRARKRREGLGGRGLEGRLRGKPRETERGTRGHGPQRAEAGVEHPGLQGTKSD